MQAENFIGARLFRLRYLLLRCFRQCVFFCLRSFLCLRCYFRFNIFYLLRFNCGNPFLFLYFYFVRHGLFFGYHRCFFFNCLWYFRLFHYRLVYNLLFLRSLRFRRNFNRFFRNNFRFRENLRFRLCDSDNFFLLRLGFLLVEIVQVDAAYNVEMRFQFLRYFGLNGFFFHFLLRSRFYGKFISFDGHSLALFVATVHFLPGFSGFAANILVFPEFSDQYVVLFILYFGVRICFYFDTFLVQKFNKAVDSHIQIFRYFY